MLIAGGHTSLMLHRAALLLGVTCIFGILARTPTALAASISLAALLTAQWHLTRALPLLSFTLAALPPLTAPLCAAAAAVAFFAVLSPLALPVQLTLGSALYGALLLIPSRRIVT
ncbi:hypothetical protein DSM109990_03298 (plasmid) [Sulfitobacter dubius]|uniref:ComEC/Rec2-related protein domain-containing protein n=1 Tax=Sulfitobacter dubius TaxID=218673 RepID=A0ABY3ZP55_9RHOB|nr:hypothetical protein DSM109990_03298 [Sulfitobacter dubius]